tara:strand:- start:448 stop:606 length:159 start_codon:yes stop_codon:yes gene_type:complete
MNKLNLILGSLMMISAVGAIETDSMPLSTAMLFGVIGSIAAVYSAYKLNEEY